MKDLMFMAVFLELNPRSIQLTTLSILAVNKAMFLYNAVRNKKKMLVN